MMQNPQKNPTESLLALDIVPSTRCLMIDLTSYKNSQRLVPASFLTIYLVEMNSDPSELTGLITVQPLPKLLQEQIHLFFKTNCPLEV